MQDLLGVESESWISEDAFLERDWTSLGIRFTFGEPAQCELIDGRTVHLWSREHVQQREAHMAVSMAEGEAEALLSDPPKLRAFRKDGAELTFAQLTRIFIQREVNASLTLKTVRQARELASGAD